MSTSTTPPLAEPAFGAVTHADIDAHSPSSPSSCVYSPSPTMRSPHEHEQASPSGSPRRRSVIMTKWGSPSSRSANGHGGDRKRYTGAKARSASAGTASGLGIAGFPPQVRPALGRTSSSPGHSSSSSPDLSRRELASSLRARGPAVIRIALPDSTSAKKGGDRTATDSAPLDLGIELSSIPSTYQETQIELPVLDAPAADEPQPAASAVAALPPAIPSPVHPADEPPTPYTPYAAQVRVSVAQRVERAPSPRKGSLAELSLKRSSTATTSSISSAGRAADGPIDAAHSSRPAPRAAPPSYVISSVSPTTLEFPPDARADAASPANSPPAPSPVGNGPGGQLITPGAKLALNLVSLSRRTAHVSDAPGYSWRLNLLEKLEVILGSFLTIEEAEAVLAIGKTEQDKPQAGTDSLAPPAGSHSTTSDAHRDRNSFLGRVKRALPGLAKEAPSPASTSKKAVFGAPLSSKNGFVTSMIAGQRHELPGVVFSTVEEIYRRGQGKKVPGMMQQHGEPSRVAKLVQIYDTPPDYGEHHDLSIESIHNVTSLLKRYLRDLPELVLDHRVCRLLLACVDSKKLPIKARVAGVQVVLRLQPPANFSLLTYVLAFLSQIPLFPENSLTIDEISTLFGPLLMSSRVAPRTKKPASHMLITGPTEPLASGVEAASRAQDALRFLLENWSTIADGLLEPDFDVDPEKVVEGLVSPTAPTVDLDLPGAELHIRQARSAESLRAQPFVADPSFVDPLLADPLLELPAMAPPREAPAPPPAALPWSALQIKKASPIVEQDRVEKSPSMSMSGPSGSTSRCSDPPTPILVLNDSPAVPASPLVRQVVQAEATSRDSPNASSTEASGTSSTRSSVSDQGSELRTPPSSTYAGTAVLEALLGGGKMASQEEDVHDLAVARRESEVADSVLSREGVSPSLYTFRAAERRRADTSLPAELPLDAFPSPPMSARTAVRLSAFLPPSPFLSQDEIAAALASDRQRESVPPVPRVELSTWEHLVEGADADFRRQEGSAPHEKELVPLPEHDESPVLDEDAVDQVEEQEANEQEDEAEDELPPPLPLKVGPYAPRSVVVFDGTFAPLLSPSTPHTLPAAILSTSSPARSLRASAPAGLDLAHLAASSGYSLPLASPSSPSSLPPHEHEQHRELADAAAHPHRREIHSLWAQLTALELERTAERAEMSDLRQEVEQFKARMAKRLERRVGLDAEERRRLDDAERRARELERTEGELRRTRDDLELIKLDAAHVKDEAHRAADEAAGLRAQLEKVEQARRAEQDEARAQVEALEAQLGSIRAVLLGKAAGN
ncbi:hypothetical protein JCM9279_005610 [Rhodotorula babjevae]